MARKNIAVLDFGSGHISVMMGSLSLNDTLNLKGYGEVTYAGFMDGEFLEPEALKEDIHSAINMAQNSAGCQITHLYIGVPAEFCSVVVKQTEMNYYTPHKITEQDIVDLYNSADNFKNERFSVVSRSPIYFMLDDGERIIKAKGKTTEKFSGLVSYTLADNKFLEIVQGALSSLNIEHVEFYGEQLSESLFLVDSEERDKCAVLIDCGFLTTSVSTIMGDGLLDLKSFSLGSGHMISDMCKLYEISPEQAEELKREVSLTEDCEGQVFEISLDNGETKEIKVEEVCEIVKYRIKQIAKTIKKCFDDSDIQIPSQSKIYITGGGLDFIEGAEELVSEVLGKEVIPVVPKVPGLDKPHLSSTVSLLNMALKNNRQTIGLFFIKLFKRK
ncbi:MAG: hypothetical protein IJ837_01080 [Clostridia bacterium]|nr:hypothetical protein [Clostridia bacterium]